MAGRLVGTRRAFFSKLTLTASVVLDFIKNVYRYRGQDYSSIMALPGATFSNPTLVGGYADNANGTMSYYVQNTPRVGKNGYVSELKSTNYVKNSVQLGSTAWTNGGSTTIALNNATAPDSTQQATLMSAASTSALSYQTGVYTTTATNQVVTMSCYIKQGASRYVNLFTNIAAAGNYASAIFDLQTGTSTQTSRTGTFSALSAAVTAMGNSWYRCQLTFTVGTSGSVLVYVVQLSSSGTPAYTDTAGNVACASGNSLYFWGPQLEVGNIVTSYIPVYPAVTNLCQQSNKLANSPWQPGAGGYSAVNDRAVAPDLSFSASLITSTGALGTIRQQITVTPNTTYTFSFYAKLGTIPSAAYSVYDNTNVANIIATTSYTSRVNTVTWSRISVTFTTPAGCTTVAVYPLRDPGAAGTLYVWGCQLELGSIAGQYVPTSPAVTNLITQSQTIGSTGWTPANCTATANNAIAPNGTTTATLMTATSAAFSVIYKSTSPYTTVANTPVTLSCHLRAGTSRYATLNSNISANNYVTVIFDLVDGMVTKTTTVGAFSIIATSITPDRNGFFRCSIILQTSTNAAINYTIGLASASNSVVNDTFGTVPSTNGTTMYSWGAQIETGGGANQYVVTTTATASLAAQTSAALVAQTSVTRYPDYLYFSPAFGLSFFNTKAMVTEGSYYTQLSTNQVMGYLSDGTTNNYISTGSYLGNFLSQMTVGGTIVRSLYQAANIASPATYRKQGVSFGNNQYIVSQNGAIVSDPSNTNPSFVQTPVFNQLAIGVFPNAGTPQMVGYVGKVQLFASALTQNQINQFTK